MQNTCSEPALDTRLRQPIQLVLKVVLARFHAHVALRVLRHPVHLAGAAHAGRCRRVLRLTTQLSLVDLNESESLGKLNHKPTDREQQAGPAGMRRA